MQMDMDGAPTAAPANTGPPPRDFHVESQAVHLEVDFRQQLLTGSTDIAVQPHSTTIQNFRFHCRQCKILNVTVDGKPTRWDYDDPYLSTVPRPAYTVRQHHLLRSKVESYLTEQRQEELVIHRPPRTTIQESEQYKAIKQETLDANASITEAGETGKYVPLVITIEFETTGLRDGLQWVGCKPGDDRWPHVYTRSSSSTKGAASCLFPCIDDAASRHPWTISVNAPRTLDDAFRRPDTAEPSAGTADEDLTMGTSGAYLTKVQSNDDLELSEQEKEVELQVICSGESTGENPDPIYQTRKICSFSIPSSISANQVGFAVGPFEDTDLSEFREADDDERLGEAAIRVHGFALPGRAPEVRNACMPLAKAIDFFTTQFTTYTGESFKLCFVDELLPDTVEVAGLSICSTRLLFPEDVIDPLPKVTKKLINTLAAQWSGIHLVPETSNDAWVIAGIRAFMTDVFLKQLSGNNEYRYQQKVACDLVYEQDLNRPSLYDLGSVLDLDPDEGRFMALKAGVVFFILDRRLVKASGSSGMSRVIGRILNNAKADDVDASYLSTQQFLSLCSKMGHVKLESFFQQWVYGAGCPSFQVMQEMNKKKLMVLMTIDQNHLERATAKKDLNPNNFLREVKEELKGVWAGEVQPYYVGSMTIRIHESDGTPYEHVVDINKSHMKIEIPYNTKYKRMKRGRRRKNLLGVEAPVEDVHDDVLLYCLGDILQGEEEMSAWRLSDWDADMEQRMSEESYEWIRMDADFEWVSKMNIKMPAYMWMSQLQQDRDVVAQMESLQWVSYETNKSPHPLISTFLLRTLLDRRYFYGIRTMAASRLANCAKSEVDWVGLYHLQMAFQEIYCMPDSRMPRPNDFSDRTSYIVQSAILQGLSDIRDNKGRAPMQVKNFFMDMLKFNDNSSNDFSDACYVSRMLECLTKALLGGPATRDDEYEESNLQKEAISEIERYRRINEWSPSFHNVFTTTALDCLVQLGKAGALRPKMQDLIRYTRSDNSDQVRLKAFDCLVELDLLREDGIMMHLLNEMATDPSPYIRENLFRIFGKGLGKVAIGDEMKEKEAPVTDGFVIEQESNELAEDTLADVQRKQTLEGALKALKAELGGKESFQMAIWAAVKSPLLSLRELSNLLDICSILFDTEDTLRVSLKLPRHWQCKHLGHGRLSFKKTGTFRTKEHIPIDWSKIKPPVPEPAPRPPPKPAHPAKPSRRTSSFASDSIPLAQLRNNAAAAAQAPAKAASPAPPEPQKRNTILKLKLGPRPSQPSANSTVAATPGGFIIPPPAATPSYPGVSPSPAPTAAPFGFGRITNSPVASRSPSISMQAPVTLHPGPSSTAPEHETTAAQVPKDEEEREVFDDITPPSNGAEKLAPPQPMNGAAAGAARMPSPNPKKRKSTTPHLPESDAVVAAAAAPQPTPPVKRKLTIKLGGNKGAGGGAAGGGA